MPLAKFCAACEIELRVKENGVLAVSMGDQGPLECYQADLWECPECGVELVWISAGQQPHALGPLEVAEAVSAAQQDRHTIVRAFRDRTSRERYLATYQGRRL